MAALTLLPVVGAFMLFFTPSGRPAVPNAARNIDTLTRIPLLLGADQERLQDAVALFATGPGPGIRARGGWACGYKRSVTTFPAYDMISECFTALG